MVIQAAMAIVVTNRVGSTQVGDPASLQKRDEPGKVLRRNRDRSRNRQSQRASCPNSIVQDLVDTSKNSPAKRRQTLPEYLIQALNFVYSACIHATTTLRRQSFG